jgi:hypothetical protein
VPKLIINSGPGVSTELVVSASIATQLKSLFAAATEGAALTLAAIVFVRWLGAGKKQEA